MPALAAVSPSPPSIARLASQGPRYTSYPAAPFFSNDFTQEEARAQIRAEQEAAHSKGISLYAHIPFCKSLCWYCGCNVKITRDRKQGASYIETLLKEVALYRELLGAVTLAELRLGGGSPNFLDVETLQRLTRGVTDLFPRRAGSVLGIELDPRDTSEDQIRVLADLGFGSLSVGVQDFDPDVQATINRLQSAEQTAELIASARAAGFSSIGVDLVYGLPGQSTDSFARTVDAVAAMAPDRIALFGYAHLPHLRPHQRLVERQPIPDVSHRAGLLCTAIAGLTSHGYQRVGFDHFARPSDPLAIAARDESLHRNFQGFTISRGGPLLACGVTGISDSGHAYWQNHSEIPAWQLDVEAGKLPVARGLALSSDDLLRRSVIYRLMCTGKLTFAGIDQEHGIDSRSHFAAELATLTTPALRELVDIDDTGVRLTGLGFELVRNVCMVFDPYVRDQVPSGSSTI